VTRTVGVLLLMSCGILGSCGAAAVDLPNPIVAENQQPGSSDWQIRSTATDVRQQIKGFASATSVNKGETVTFYVTVTPAQTYSLDVYRVGWYQGFGGRLLQHLGPLPGIQQPTCPVADVTGLIECDWSPGASLTVPTTWTSGVFLVKLTNAAGFQNYITFVVRDDDRPADLLYQASVTTYQAYNNYPDDNTTGKSLYEYNSFGANSISGTPRAVKVSFDRPYADDGSGQFLAYEVYFVRWLERAGYDVSYSTDIDTHRNSIHLLDYKGFLSVGHDEYWSSAMYDGVEQARAAGVHLGFFGANAVYWQIRFEASSQGGTADRVIVCYRDVALDKVHGPTTTTLWRDRALSRPEQGLVGVQYFGALGAQPRLPYVATNTGHWVYQGTGMSDGDRVPGIQGVEVDWSDPAGPRPSLVTGTYTLLSQSPVATSNGVVSANASIYQAPSGAWVFGAGTITWSEGLDRPGVADTRIQRITANVLNRFISSAAPTRSRR
jgi:hypothetical protein